MAQDKKDLLVGNYKTRETKFGTIESLGFREEDLKKMLAHCFGGWVNIDLKVSQKGNKYMEINTYTPKQGAAKPKVEDQVQNAPDVREYEIEQAQKDDDLPF